MVRRFKFTMDILKNMDQPMVPPSDVGPLNTPPAEEDSKMGFLKVQLSTPPLTNVSPNYTYDNQTNDYFKYKLKIAQPHLNTTLPIVHRSPDDTQKINSKLPQRLQDQLDLEQVQFISPIEEDEASSSSSYLGRRGSIVPSTAPTSVNTPVSDDKSYMPLTSSHKFMCVDDNKINLRILSKLIGKLYPYSEIHTTTNPLEALTMIDQNNYDLCFIDIEMPELSGKELASRVRCTHHSLGLIAVTTKASPEDVLQYESLGIDSTFAKPLQCPYNQIMDCVDSVIVKRKLQ